MSDSDRLLTIRAASRLSGKDERTIRRYLSQGKLASVVTPQGRRIERDELLRTGLLLVAPDKPQEASGGHAQDVAAEAALLQERIAHLEAERDLWREQAAAWQRQAETLVLALSAAPIPMPASEADAKPDKPAAPVRRGFWQRLAGR